MNADYPTRVGQSCENDEDRRGLRTSHDSLKGFLGSMSCATNFSRSTSRPEHSVAQCRTDLSKNQTTAALPRTPNAFDLFPCCRENTPLPRNPIRGARSTTSLRLVSHDFDRTRVNRGTRDNLRYRAVHCIPNQKPQMAHNHIERS